MPSWTTRSTGILKKCMALDELLNKNLNKPLRHLGMGLLLRNAISSLPMKKEACFGLITNPSLAQSSSALRTSASCLKP